jgi:hypothetical protein
MITTLRLLSRGVMLSLMMADYGQVALGGHMHSEARADPHINPSHLKMEVMKFM